LRGVEFVSPDEGIGTFYNDIIYDRIIDAFSRAIDRLRKEEQAITLPWLGLVISIGRHFLEWGRFFFFLGTNDLGKTLRYNDTRDAQ